MTNFREEKISFLGGGKGWSFLIKKIVADDDYDNDDNDNDNNHDNDDNNDNDNNDNNDDNYRD